MCGISAYLGNDEAIDYLISSMYQLLNRGYDSIGICSIKNNNEFVIHKYASVNGNDAISKIEEIKHEHNGNNIGMQHERWATHGDKTDKNSHPHIDQTGRFAIVHNGTIDNYYEMKDDLVSKGYIFQSETDTEVIVQWISYEYNSTNNVYQSIQNTINKLRGSFALIIMDKMNTNGLYCVRNETPLLLSIQSNFILISSEIHGFCNKVNDYICLKDRDLLYIEKKKNKIECNSYSSYPLKYISKSEEVISPEPYLHWTLKEIHDQPFVIAKTMENRLYKNQIRLEELELYSEELKNIQHCILLGCGTSYHSCLLATKIFKEFNIFNTVQAFDACDFTIHDIPKIGETCFILVSQSGETKDLVQSLQIAKQKSIITIGVINVIDSMIARNVTIPCYLKCGREVAVASTKAFTCQVVLLILIGCWFHQYKYNLPQIDFYHYLSQIPEQLKICIHNIEEQCKIISKNIKQNQSLIALGRNKSEIIMKEACLKIKEISYIHAEAFNSGSLKHGPLALIDNQITIFLLINNDEDYNKNITSFHEIKSRGANIILISNMENIHNELKNRNDIIPIPQNKYFSFLLEIIPLQFIAYYLSIEKGINPDYPKNLAKVVTVD